MLNAKKANNIDILIKVEEFERSNRVIAYHLICYINFIYECERVQSKVKTEYHHGRDCYAAAYTDVCDYVNTTVIEQKSCITLKQLHTIGLCKRRQQSINRKRLSKSYAQDSIYGVTNGRLKTGKHITLAMALKCSTSSRNVVVIVNRYGHSCSYTIVEELTTEATYFVSARSQLCPNDIVRKPNLCTSLALLILIDESIENFNLIKEHESNIKTKRRRTFDAVTSELQPLTKKTNIEQVIKLFLDAVFESSASKNQKRVNLPWMISHSLGIPSTPM
ncbi:hypothetical protein PV325_001992 [Microctonus aethiopoides]|nr:hypothetical protein PV325_001992 [Microctonus aethiopoides]